MLQTFRTNSRSDIRLLSSAAERATYTRVLAISRSRADLPPNSCTHRGDFYHVAGPLNVPRCPQGWPVLVQAGSKRLAAAEGRLADPLPAGIYSGGISPSLAEVAPRCRYAAPDGCAGRSVDRRRRCAVTIPASATRPVPPERLAANEAGCARISLRCASMRRKIALNSPGIWGMSAKMAPQLVSRVSPGLQA